MWGWLGIFLGLLGGLISIAPIQEFIRIPFPNIRVLHLQFIRIIVVLFSAIAGIFGLLNRMHNEQKLNSTIENIRNANEKALEGIKRTSSGQFDFGGFITGNPIYFNNKTTEAINYIKQGKLDKALDSVNDAAKIASNDYNIAITQLLREEIFIEKKQFMNALEELNKINESKLDSNNKINYFRDLEFCYDRLGNVQKRDEYLQKFQELHKK